MTGNFADANNSYNCLEAEFQRRMSKDLIELVWGLVLIPLSDDRKRVSDHFHYLYEYCQHLKETKIPVMDNQNLLLSKLCTCETSQEVYGSENLKFWGYESSAPRLDFERYEKSIWTLINRKSFFKRFSDMPKDTDNFAMYRRILVNAKVELYGKGQVVFTQDRIAIVMMGSCEVRKHNNKDLLKPYIVKKAVEGDILGWADGDCSYSSSPLSWIYVMQDNTEVIFIGKSDFEKLWGL